MLNITDKALELLEHVHVNMPWRYLSRYLDLILEYGLHLELGFAAQELDRVERREFGNVSDLLQQRGCRLTLHGPFWDLCPGSSDAFIRQVSRLRLHQFFDLVAVFNPVQMVCHTGFDSRHHSSDFREWLERALAVWEPLVARAEQLETRFLLENVWESGPSLHRAIFDSLPSPYFGFCLDVGHQHTFSDTPMIRWLEILGDRLQELHVHDNDGAADAHLPVGAGTVDFPGLFALLRAKRPRPLLTLEPHEKDDFARTMNKLAEVLPADWFGNGAGGPASV